MMLQKGQTSDDKKKICPGRSDTFDHTQRLFEMTSGVETDKIFKENFWLYADEMTQLRTREEGMHARCTV